MKTKISILLILTSILSINVFSKSEEIKLGKITMFNDLVEIKVPTNFSVMHDYEVKKMYPADNLPKIVHADSLRSIRLAFNYIKGTGVEIRLAAMKAGYLSDWQKTDPKLKELSEGIVTVDGRDMAYLGVLHKSPEKVYRFLFFTDYRGMLLTGELICPKKKYKDWIVVGEKVMYSLHIREK